MKLLINTASTLKGGGVQVAKSFIEECQSYTENEYHVILGITLSKLIDTTSFPKNFHFYKINYRPATRVFSFKTTAGFMKEIEKTVQPDCVFTTSGPAYWRPKSPHLMGYNLPHYVYQDSPFFQLLSYKKKLFWKLKGKLIKYFIKNDADAYVVQTDDVNQRLKRWIGSEKVYTVTNTFGSHFNALPTSDKDFLPSPKKNEFRLLMLSSFYAHKNFQLINNISVLLEKQDISTIHFVLTLPQNIFEHFFTSTAKKYITNVGTIKPEECPQLYKECSAVFLPTLLECFSATYAEGMKMQKPILTSDLGFAHTTCKDAALYFHPLEANKALEQILLLYNSPQLQKELVKNGQQQLLKFNTPSERADKYLEYCQKITHGKN